ncbi:MAG: hypothetical protein JWP97_1730 [Labilithrix sp.]|nr:hypothetical protein [Labilithrix sp.]
MVHALPHHLVIDVLTGLFLFALVGTFVALARAYAGTQPLLLIAMPIPIASVLIVLIVIHDRRVAGS